MLAAQAYLKKTRGRLQAQARRPSITAGRALYLCPRLARCRTCTSKRTIPAKERARHFHSLRRDFDNLKLLPCGLDSPGHLSVARDTAEQSARTLRANATALVRATFMPASAPGVSASRPAGGGGACATVRTALATTAAATSPSGERVAAERANAAIIGAGEVTADPLPQRR